MLYLCYNNECIMQGGCNMNFSNSIKKLRTKCLLSQEDFAKAIGVSFSTVNRWETGKTMPTFKAMKLIDEYCKSNALTFDFNFDTKENN